MPRQLNKHYSDKCNARRAVRNAGLADIAFEIVLRHLRYFPEFNPKTKEEAERVNVRGFTVTQCK